MKTERPVRVGVFRTRPDAERVAAEARSAGFREVRILSDESFASYRHDPGELPGRAVDVTPATLPHEARRLPLEGAALGLGLGFLGAWVLGVAGVMNEVFGFLVLPVAGALFCGLIGAMLTRGFTTEPDEFYDQDAPEGSFVVAIEDPDPARLALAEEILAKAGASPLPLGEG